MPSGQAEIPEGNRLLDSLPATDKAELAPHLEQVRLELKELLCEPGKRIDSVYFPLTAVASLLNLVEGTSGVEIATVGNEGLVGLSVSWGIDTVNPREFVQCQVPGDALVMDEPTFATKVAAGGELTWLVHRYTQAFVSQIGQQVACNGLHSIEERCARWMLLTHDRVGSNEFPLTQEFLAQMLGVRRPSVTVVAGILQQAGFIRFHRGRITITDRRGLENASCECYRVLREVFDRLV
ncbi:MAG TPA: Crp/Fnr family transcriptional regulator [Acidimicrobiales bacterium]|jgi:CRP-like cAMP-binding protein|nr:Crp/Fnr family transcriptional regulator [Acidimicrobiales bacterium]